MHYDRKKDTFLSIFKAVKEIIGDSLPKAVYRDFEMAQLLALQEVFDTSAILGDRFHLIKAIKEKQRAYKSLEISNVIVLVKALIDATDEETFEVLHESFCESMLSSAEGASFLEYWRRTWSHEGSFPPSLWANCHRSSD